MPKDHPSLVPVVDLEANKEVLEDMVAVPRRNDRYFDMWSLLHLSVGALFGWLVAPAPAIVLLVAWEPLENFVLSPLLARVGIHFGFESLRNALSDIVFDMIGLAFGIFVLGTLWQAPFHIF